MCIQIVFKPRKANTVRGSYIQEIFPKNLIFYFIKNSNKW